MADLAPGSLIFTASAKIRDSQTDRELWVDEFYALRTNPMHRLIGKSFVGVTKDTNFWTETVTGSGVVTQGGGEVLLNTGATANSTVQYRTIRIARWVSGLENTFRGIVKLDDTGTANNTRNWGALDATNGLFFQLTGTTLNVVSRKGGVDTEVPQASWNGAGAAGFVLDTNYNLYEIKYTQADIHFYINHILVHTLTPLGDTDLLCDTLDLPVSLQNNNSGGGISSVNLYAAIAFVMRSGDLETEPIYKNITSATTTVCKYGAGRLHRIILNSTGGTSLSIYDNTAGSGTLIGTLITGSIASVEYGAPFFIGLTIVSVGAVDATLIYE